jgi:hypothetical protein
VPIASSTTPRAAIQIRAQDLEDAPGGKAVVAAQDRHFTLKALRAADKFGSRPGVKTEFIEDFDFSLHVIGNIGEHG